MSWIQTHSGLKFDLLAPCTSAICIEDIAHALSHLCRFTGHTRAFYSVAQHSVLVSRMVSPRNKVAALLHDATEAYVNDMATPLKRLIPDYSVIEARIWRAIARRFDLPVTLPAEVKQADTLILHAERRAFLGPPPAPWPGDGEITPPTLALDLSPWSPVKARQQFLAIWRELNRAAPLRAVAIH